jgi:hypothetical protein
VGIRVCTCEHEESLYTACCLVLSSDVRPVQRDVEIGMPHRDRNAKERPDDLITANTLDISIPLTADLQCRHDRLEVENS